MDYWVLLSQDVACEIIRKMTKLQDVLSYTWRLHRHSDTMLEFVSHILIPTAYLEVPIEWLVNFPNLQIADQDHPQLPREANIIRDLLLIDLI